MERRLGSRKPGNNLSLKSKLDLTKLWSMLNRSRKGRRKNIRKGDMVLLWKRPPGRRDTREDTLEDVCKFNNLGSYMNKRSNEMFENCNVVFDVRSYYIILPICAILQKAYLTSWYTLSSAIQSTLNNILPALLPLCLPLVFKQRKEKIQLQTNLLQWYQTPWLSLFQSRHGYPVLSHHLNKIY